MAERLRACLRALLPGEAGAAQLVGDRWLTDSIARNERQNAAAHAWGAVEERPEEAAPARRSDVLPKFGCQRKITKADDQNKQLTGWLKQQLEWWQNGCIEGDASQHTAVGLTYKVIALIRSWPTTVWKSNIGRPTPSTRRCLRHCVCAIAWRFAMT